MCESPCSLEELCLDTICDNILSYVESHKYDEPSVWFGFDEGEEIIKKYKFRDNDLFLINEISEKLLLKFQQKKIMCDALLNIFTERNTRLRNVRLKNCKISTIGLNILKQHRINELHCVNIKYMCIGEMLDCLSEWSLDKISSVNFSKCTFIDSSGYNIMTKICRLKQLRSLNLAYTELNQEGFEIICLDLKLLENLDISGTVVEDLSPIVKLSSKLVNLGICDLPGVVNVLSLEYLTQLKHLDIGLFKEKVDYQAYSTCPVMDLLESSNILLPNLISLDISGWRDYITSELLLNFIHTHTKLEFLGIVLTVVSFEPVFSDLSHKHYPHHLVIAGLGNEKQIKVTLKKYKDRSSYVQKALYYLFRMTNSPQEARPDMFKLVLPVMEAHSSKFGVQVAATACLYNLTRGDLSKHIHPKSLSQGVNLTLYAMSAFPEEFQLQKNSLLTLCSDRILQEVSFDRFQCAKLVLDALCAFEDINMNRMAVAICSILASKVSTAETSELGARPSYMRKLLAMVQSRVASEISDITLKFTLSALWNLTDESAATCTVFLQQGGAYMFLNVLKAFKDDSAIETKVLGLFNNIAEVSSLRSSLMLDYLMNELFLLLKSENIDVSYFAAGIVAHLASDGVELWKVVSHTRSEMLLELENAVLQWDVPESEMVAYRSFKPFFPLLKKEMDYQVQLWAVWAIHHVCTKNPKRYCLLLKEEKGHTLLSDLLNCAYSNSKIKTICARILDTLETNCVSPVTLATT